TDCCCDGWISETFCCFVIGVPPASIVSLIGTPTSWKSPESSTVTTNARSAETLIVAGVLDVKSVPCGVTRTETSPSPCLPPGEPFRPQLDGVDQVLMNRAQRSGRPDLLRLRVGLLLLLGVLLQRRLEVGLLQAGRDELRREVLSELLVALRDRPHLVGVGLV